MNAHPNMPDAKRMRQVLLGSLFTQMRELRNQEQPEADLEELELISRYIERAELVPDTPASPAAEYRLVKGSFNSDDANSVLSALFNSKIDFHVRSALGQELREGKSSPKHTRRIFELQQDYSQIKQLIDLARELNLQVRVNAAVEIKLISG